MTFLLRKPFSLSASLQECGCLFSKVGEGEQVLIPGKVLLQSAAGLECQQLFLRHLRCTIFTNKSRWARRARRHSKAPPYEVEPVVRLCPPPWPFLDSFLDNFKGRLPQEDLLLALGPHKLGEPHLHDYEMECSMLNRAPPNKYDLWLLNVDHLDGPLGIQGTLFEATGLYRCDSMRPSHSCSPPLNNTLDVSHEIAIWSLA